jgi:hypothetical protein
MKSLISSTTVAILASLVRAQSQDDLVALLRLAPTEVDRLNILQDSQVRQLNAITFPPTRQIESQFSQFVFDFFNPPSGIVTGAGGHLVEAYSANFAAVVGNGVAMALGFLGWVFQLYSSRGSSHQKIFLTYE